MPPIAQIAEITRPQLGPARARPFDMLKAIDLSNVIGGAGSDWATGGFWTGRTRDDEERAERSGSRLATGGFWTGRTQEEVDRRRGRRSADD